MDDRWPVNQVTKGRVAGDQGDEWPAAVVTGHQGPGAGHHRSRSSRLVVVIDPAGGDRRPGAWKAGQSKHSGDSVVGKSVIIIPPYIAELFPPEDRDWWFGFDRSAMNLGLSVGVLLSGWVASVGGTGAYHWLLLVSALGYFVTGVLILAIPSSTPFRSAMSKHIEKPLSYLTVLRDRPFLGFIVAQATLFLSFAVLLMFAQRAKGMIRLPSRPCR